MKYPDLIDSCKKAIEKGYCLGCSGLEDVNYRGNSNCKYAKQPTAKDYIKQIKLNLGDKK